MGLKQLASLLSAPSRIAQVVSVLILWPELGVIAQPVDVDLLDPPVLAAQPVGHSAVHAS